MWLMKIVILLILSSFVYANAPLSINSKIPSYDVLPTAQIYIDKTRSLTFQDIQTKEKEFFSNDKKLLGFGYAPSFDVWVKFTLTNETDHSLEKILEYDKDVSYFYYVLYIFGVMVHHGIYVGLANIYILNHEWIIWLIGLTPLIVAFPIVALALFSRSFQPLLS